MFKTTALVCAGTVGLESPFLRRQNRTAISAVSAKPFHRRNRDVGFQQVFLDAAAITGLEGHDSIVVNGNQQSGGLAGADCRAHPDIDRDYFPVLGDDLPRLSKGANRMAKDYSADS